MSMQRKDKIRMKKQTKASIGESTSNVNAAEGDIAENMMKNHPGLYQNHSKGHPEQSLQKHILNICYIRKGLKWLIPPISSNVAWKLP